MGKVVKNAAYGLKDSFRLVQGNAKVIILVQPFWAITYNMYYPFLTLYMNKLGCSYAQIGIINAIGMVAGTVIAVFAGWITDRLGRRLTCLIADMTCWAFACLLWGAASGFACLVAASLANAMVRLISVSWNCMLAEGTPPQNRMNVYWWINIMGTVAVFATPAMNLLIDPFGLVPAMRWVLLATSAILVVAFLARHHYLKELPIGLECMKASRNDSPLDALKAYAPLIRLLRRNPVLLVCIVIRALYYMQLNIRSAYLPVTVVDGLGFRSDAIGTISLITGVVMLLAQFLLLPVLKSISPAKAMYASLSALIASTAMLMFSPLHSGAMLWISTILYAAGSLVAVMMVDTEAANAMPDAWRAQLMGLLTVLMVALSAPFMWLGGLLADLPGMGPRLPLGLNILVFAVCIALQAAASAAKKREPRGG